MYLPALSNMEQRRQQQIITFGGINYGQNTQEGQLADCRNLTAEHFPCLHPRAGRKTAVSGLTAPEQIFAAEGNLYIVDNGALKLGDSTLLTLTPGKKQLAAINSKLVVFPDKKWYDMKTGEAGTLFASYNAPAGSISFGEDGKTVTAHLGSYRVEKTGTGTLGIREAHYETDEDGEQEYIGEKGTLEGSETFTVADSYTLDAETGALTFANERSVILAQVNNDNDITKKNIQAGTLFRKAERPKWTGGEYTPETLFAQLPAGQYAVVTECNTYQTRPITPPGGTPKPSPKPYFGIRYDLYAVNGQSYGDSGGWEAMGFRAGDTVRIRGCTTFPENNGTHTIREIRQSGETYTLVFSDGAFPKPGTEAGAVSFERYIPELEVLCESQNRLWGAAGGTVYASALGDPCNWETFDGLSTDSYALAVAGGEPFTACCGYGSGVLFFKEDMVYKILGGYPAEYTLYSYHYPGVQLGSAESLININEVLYYKGAAGVWRYAGAAPELISGAFGLRQYTNAWAGRCGQRYYLSMKGKDGGYGVWVYDTLRGFWLQEDERNAGFAWSNGRFYLLDRGAKKVYLTGQDNSEETRVPWSAELCAMDEVVHNRKSYSRLLLRADFEAGSWLKAEISMDGGPWQTAGQWSAGHGQTRVIPLLPRRCDRFRIRLSGEGNVMLRSLTRDYTLGSEY